MKYAYLLEHLTKEFIILTNEVFPLTGHQKSDGSCQSPGIPELYSG